MVFLSVGASEGRAQRLDSYFPEFVSSIASRPEPAALTRRQAEYEALGVRVGSFVVRPLLREAVGYDSNVFGVRDGPGSPVVGTSASVGAASDWKRHSLNAFIGVNDRRFLTQPGQNTTTWTASLGGAYDIGRSRLYGSYTHLDLVETRSDIGAVVSVRPVRYRVENGQVGYNWSGRGPLSLLPELTASAYSFDRFANPGDASGQSYRDRLVLQAGLTARYELAPRRGALVVLRGTKINYGNRLAGSLNRDSLGGTVLVGLEYSTTSLYRYRVLVGYQQRNYASRSFRSLASPVAEASVTWFPNRLATVTATVRRDIQDAADESSSSFTLTSFRLGAAYEPLRNVLLTGAAEVQLAEFGSNVEPLQNTVLRQDQGSQTLYGVEGGVTLLLTRNARLTGSYGFSYRQAGPVGTYGRSVGQLSLTLSL